MQPNLTAQDFETLFQGIEGAIDAHPTLERIQRYEPELRVDRAGFSVRITVRLKGSHKRPSVITGNGDTPQEALENLVHGLDFWAEAIV